MTWKNASFFRRGLIGLALFGWVLIFGEGFVRLFAPVALMPRYVTGAPYGIRMNIPNASYWETTQEVHVEVRTNSQGIRADREYAIEKPPGVCRVLMQGDSFFMGYEVDLKNSIQALVEKGLNDTGYPCEVINLAVSGFGTAEELITLRAAGLRYQPDVLLLEMHSSDLDDNVRSGLFRLDANGLKQTSQVYLPGIQISDKLMRIGLYRWLIENSQFYSYARERIATTIKKMMLTSATAVPDENAPASRDNSVLDYERRLNLALVDEITKTLPPQSRLMMLEIPDSPSRTKFTSAHPIEPGNVYEQRGQYISILDELSAAARPDLKLYYEKGHGHLTPVGTAIAADKTVKALIKLPELQQYRQSAK